MRGPRRRAGMGTMVILATGIVALLGVVAIAHLGTSSQALDTATRDAGAAVAEELASSVVEEAAWRLQKAITNPGDTLYWTLRRAVLSGQSPYVDLTPDLDPVLVRRRLESASPGSVLSHARIEHFRVVLHVPVMHRIPAPGTGSGGQPLTIPTTVDGHQMVDFECGVSLRVADRSIYRRSAQRRRYGVMLASMYKPFDQMTLAIVEHGFLTGMPGMMRTWDNRILGFEAVRERLEWIRSAIAGPGQEPPPPGAPAPPALTGRAAGAGDLVQLEFAPPLLPSRRPPGMSPLAARVAQEELEARRRREPRLDERVSAMSADERGWFMWDLALGRQEVRVRIRLPRVALPDVERLWPALDASLVVRDVPLPTSVVFSLDRDVDLAEFDHEVRLRERERELLPAMDEQFERINDLWVRWTNADPVTLGAAELRAFVTEVSTRGRTARKQLESLAGDFNRLVAHVAAHTRIGLTSEALDGYIRRSSHRLSAVGYHLEGKGALTAALKRYPVFNGHISVSGREPQDLDAPRFAGKAIISRPYATPGHPAGPALVVKGLGLASRSDLVILDGDNIDLAASRVEAGIFAQDTLRIRSSGTAISGVLLMRRLKPLSQRKPDEELKGTITFDPRYASGAVFEAKVPGEDPHGIGLDHYIVTLCPRGIERAVLRTPPEGDGR